jgi:hypothetical protein
LVKNQRGVFKITPRQYWFEYYGYWNRMFRREVLELNESVMDTGPFMVTPMERSCLMEGSKKQSKGLVRDDANHPNFGGLGDHLHPLLSEEQEHGPETLQQALANRNEHILVPIERNLPYG